MSATEQTRHIKEPIAGRWAWRDYGPKCNCELEDLRTRVMSINPDGIDVFRFIAWVEAEFSGKDHVGVPRGAAALAKYRRFLYELNVDHEPAHAGDVVLAELECSFEREAATAGEAGEAAALQNVDGWRSRVAA